MGLSNLRFPGSRENIKVQQIHIAIPVKTAKLSIAEFIGAYIHSSHVITVPIMNSRLAQQVRRHTGRDRAVQRRIDAGRTVIESIVPGRWIAEKGIQVWGWLS